MGKADLMQDRKGNKRLEFCEDHSRKINDNNLFSFKAFALFRW